MTALVDRLQHQISGQNGDTVVVDRKDFELALAMIKEVFEQRLQLSSMETQGTNSAELIEMLSDIGMEAEKISVDSEYIMKDNKKSSLDIRLVGLFCLTLLAGIALYGWAAYKLDREYVLIKRVS